MEHEDRRRGVRSFLIGGLVGASAVAATVRRGARRRARSRQRPAGLAAFESAPCYRELLEQDAAGVTERRADAEPEKPSAG